MDDLMDTSTSQKHSDATMLPSNPATWSVLDAAVWLQKCSLEQFVPAFQANMVDGSVLMDDNFDEAMVKELIPNLKHRLTFINARKQLRENEQIGPVLQVTVSTASSATLVNTACADSISAAPKAVQQKAYFFTRNGIKAHCEQIIKKPTTTRLNITHLLQPANTVHTSAIPNVLDSEALHVLEKSFAYLCKDRVLCELDCDFNIIVNESLTAPILIREILHSHCLQSYVLDSLKRYDGLRDVTQALSSCLDLPQVDTAAESFLEIIDQITKNTLLVCTIESLSFESQRFLGNLIRKNDLPIPLAYYVHEKNESKFKINFNLLAETFCFSNERILLYLGSPSAIGLGKTGILQYLFEDKRSNSLNIEGNSSLRSGCIDTMFALLKKDDPYIVFDVHGSMTTMNEDLVTAIQLYCTVQILFVTEADLHNGDFLRATMNYSAETRIKPTIIVIFDPRYGEKNALSSLDTFQHAYATDKWKNTVWITAPVQKKTSDSSRFHDERRSKRLRDAFIEAFASLQTSIQNEPICESIFAIEAYLLSVKSAANSSPPPICKFEIRDTLESLFGQLSDRTNNLEIVTPVSYLDSIKLKHEKELSQLWNESSNDLRARLEQIQQKYQTITQIPKYSAFFIDLLTKRTDIELLMTEMYLKQWRAKFESDLADKLVVIKNAAMSVASGIKMLEEQCQINVESQKQAETENVTNQLRVLKQEYKEQQDQIIEIENQLANIDLTIGLFCDEIFALYEYLPRLFEPNAFVELLAKKLTKLMYKGFAFHVLRGRPLRCHSKLIQTCLNFVQQSSIKKPLVLTVIGEQSSAKSSLLNATFGCNFRVSAGRCTIGMYLSLVRWQSHTIAIFDTEGLLSLEESDSIFDNQMVSMAMLSSHLVLINHKGEFSSNLQHLIGMSFYAKLQIRSPLRPKLLFILRDQSDTSVTNTFIRQLTKLKENLYHDSKFLKSSIDKELEIKEQNVILLSNAFLTDINPILRIKQTWRSEAFSSEIVELRKMILQCLGDANREIYSDVPEMYQKIDGNWNAIDTLGPNLLACKTLYELSIMNQLRDIANEITGKYITAVNNEGRQLIDRELASITSENYNQFDAAHFNNQFCTAMKLVHGKIMREAHEDYHTKTERSCFPLEIKHKMEKLIEPAILNMQGMLREEFNERMFKARRDARVSSAQQHFIDAIQKEFDRNTNLGVEALQKRVDQVYETELEACQQTFRPEFEPPDQILTKILKFYNSTLAAKAGNTTTGSVYNLLHPLDKNHYQVACERIEGIWNCILQLTQSPPYSNNTRWKRFKAFVKWNGSNDHVKEVLNDIYMQVEWWFSKQSDPNKNKKLLSEIVQQLLVQLHLDVVKLVTDHFLSSDPRLINNMFTFIENMFNHDTIIHNKNHLNLHNMLADIAIMTLKTWFDEIIKVEQLRRRQETDKMRKDMQEWKERIATQVHHMRNSFEQGKNMADIVTKAIFKQFRSVVLDRILSGVTEDIARSQFINHEAMQKQAYEESFGQGNGEKILKYVLDINRYFLELSLREIKTPLEAAVHTHTLNAEQAIMSAFNTANDVVDRSKSINVRLVAREIEREITGSNTFTMPADDKFTLAGVVSLPIENLSNFQQGFKTILVNTTNIHERVTKLTRNVKKDAYDGCKARIKRRLGCQSRCPGCGSKCSRPEPHDKELVEQWHECQCAPENCHCDRPEALSHDVHHTEHHIAQAFHGRKYYKTHTPSLELCYQRWKTGAMYRGDEEIVPLQKFYIQHYPEWYNNLHALSTEGRACAESIAPPEQRRAWMIVRDVLLARYAESGMVDHDNYNRKQYPLDVSALPKDFEPTWEDAKDS